LCRVGAGAAADAVRCLLSSPLLNRSESEPPPAPKVEPSRVAVRGLFRGQQINYQSDVNLFPLADNVWSRPPLPQLGSIAVRASDPLQDRFGASNGSIAIVLDCSGSMGPPEGEKFGPATKYYEATQALQNVVRKLPRGTTV